MAIIVLKRPFDRSWTGNPIHYTLYSAAAEAAPENYFEYRIKFKRADQAAFTEVITLPYQPVNGAAKIDIQDILDGKMEYELPQLPADNEYASPSFSKKMTGFFYIDFREITPNDADPDWDETEENHQLFAIKGGISFHKWRGDNFWINYFDVRKPFLTWEKNKTLHALTERMYLAWLNLTDEPIGNIKMRRTLKFTDGSEDIVDLDCAVEKYHVCYFPSGAAQLELSLVDAQKTIYYWEMQVVNMGTNPNEPLSELFRYYADNRNDYNAITLNYRNSLGGIGSLRVRGVIDYTLNRAFTESERVVMHDYFENHFISGRRIADNSTEIQVMKGDIGYLEKEQQDRLRDMHFKREVWWEQQLKWLPVMLLTGSNRLRLSTDKLFAMPLEFCIASGDESFYTPEGVNLADKSANQLICTAVIENLQYSYDPGTGWTITWDLASGSPVKYYISTPGVNGGGNQESATTEYTFPWLPVGVNVITVRPVCYIGDDFYEGEPQTIEITVEAPCIDVGINDTPVYLPDAIEDTAYTYTINLTGTAPFAIDTVVKPAWMTIAVAGSTVLLTGTPTGADIATDIEVSFNITNCADGTVPFSDLIDVVAAGPHGVFAASNETEGLNYIKRIYEGNVFNPFFVLTSGAFPVGEAQTVDGFITRGFNTSIGVSVILIQEVQLHLYKNAILMETIEAPVRGTYTFTAINVLVSDDIEVKMTD